MPDRAWKQNEREIARLWGGARNPRAGATRRTGSRGDVNHPALYIEVKSTSRVPFWTTWLKTSARAKSEGKQPLVIFKAKGRHGYVAMVDAKWLAHVLQHGKER